jgi:type VI secretion system protein ImpA
LPDGAQFGMPVDEEAWLRPVSDATPCGENLAESGWSPFFALRMFGSKIRLEERYGRRLGPDINWREVRTLAVTNLSKSKDLRVLVHLAASVIRLEGIASLVITLEVASAWLTRFWDDVYPRITEEEIDDRKAALGDFADPMAIIDPLRRATLVSHRQLGSCSFRDIEMSSRPATPAADDSSDAPPANPKAAIDAIFAATAVEDLAALEHTLLRGMAALDAIEERMSKSPSGAPHVAPLSDLLQQIVQKVRPYLQARRAAMELLPPAAHGEPLPQPLVDPMPTNLSNARDERVRQEVTLRSGPVASREEAIRSLAAIAEFFRQTEPSSPVPLFIERTVRMISMDFMELLEEIAPESVDKAKSAAGIRESQGNK